MSPMQLRLARTLASVSRAKLAKLSGVSLQTIGNYERGDTQIIRANHDALARTLESLGVEFLEDDGVKRRKG
jgi:transcriptional regulator with XRE-family HTH domain